MLFHLWEGNDNANSKTAHRTFDQGVFPTWVPWHMYGFDGNDTLTGESIVDIIDGGAGVDIMRGGRGNDTYKLMIALSNMLMKVKIPSDPALATLWAPV